MSPLTKTLVAVGLLASTAASIHPICRRPGCLPANLMGHESDVPAPFTASLVDRDEALPATTFTGVVVVETAPPTPTTDAPTTTVDASSLTSTSTSTSDISVVDLDLIDVELPSESTDGVNQTMPYTAFLRQAVQAIAIATVDHTLIVTGAYNGTYDLAPLQDQLGQVVGLVQKFGYDYGINRTQTCTTQYMAAMVQAKKVILPALDSMGDDGAISSFFLDVALVEQQVQTMQHLAYYPVNGNSNESAPADGPLGSLVIPVAPIMLPFQGPAAKPQGAPTDTDPSKPADSDPVPLPAAEPPATPPGSVPGTPPDTPEAPPHSLDSANDGPASPRPQVPPKTVPGRPPTAPHGPDFYDPTYKAPWDGSWHNNDPFWNTWDPYRNVWEPPKRGRLGEMLSSVKNVVSDQWARFMARVMTGSGGDALTTSNLLKHNPHIRDPLSDILKENAKRGYRRAHQWVKDVRDARASTSFEQKFTDLKGKVRVPKKYLPRKLPQGWNRMAQQPFNDMLQQVGLQEWVDDISGVGYSDMWEMGDVIRRVDGELVTSPHGALPQVAWPRPGSPQPPPPGPGRPPLLPFGQPPNLPPRPPPEPVAGPSTPRPRPRPHAPPDQGPADPEYTSQTPQQTTPVMQPAATTRTPFPVPTTLLTQASSSTSSSSSSSTTSATTASTPPSTPLSSYRSGCDVPLSITGNDDATQEEFSAAQVAHDPIAYAQEGCIPLHLASLPPTSTTAASPAQATSPASASAWPNVAPCFPPPVPVDGKYKSGCMFKLITSETCDATPAEFQAAKAKGDPNAQGQLCGEVDQELKDDYDEHHPGWNID